ncbi:dual specificity protein phosphatase 14 [Trichomycterus rosablanca]|uniref:dual specificity protein phosphatase 14 n=1 Tax=Trichomycterus rosablanca TaxID=2290929 RepID=UPI002F353B56
MSAISQVTPRLYLSGIDALNPSALAHRRVTLVVCLCDPPSRSQHTGTEWVCVPVRDEPHAPLHRHFDALAELIHLNRSGSSLVCCAAGRSRSPSLVMAYLMRFEGTSLLEAYLQVLDARPFIRPNAGFWRQLLDYERRLHSSNSVRMVSSTNGVLPESITPTKDCGYCLNI